MPNVYLWVYGGYGDSICAYLNGGWGISNTQGCNKSGKGSIYWDRLKSLKKITPSIGTRVIVMSGNPQTMMLVANNPYVDEIIRIPTLRDVNTAGTKVQKYINKHINGHQDIDLFIKKSNCVYPSNVNQIYLDNIEDQIYNDIIKQTQGKYIVIHPYASIETRRPVNDQEYVSVAERIEEETGYKSIVLGGSFNKKSLLDNGNYLNSTITEDFYYESDSIINLVNKSSMILGTKLTMNALITIGAWSCHTTSAMSLGKPTVIFTTPKAFSYLSQISKKKFARALPFNRTFITDTITEHILDLTIEHVLKNII